MINLFYLVVGIGFLFSLVVRGWLGRTNPHWSRVRNSLDLPAASVLRHLLDVNAMPQFRVTLQPSKLIDHYDPRKKTIRLSAPAHNASDIASAPIAESRNMAAALGRLKLNIILRWKSRRLGIMELMATSQNGRQVVLFFILLRNERKKRNDTSCIL